MTHSEHMASRRVLVIDDSADLLELYRNILEINNYEVFTAKGGQEALQTLTAIAPPDLILLDLRMENMSGPEFLDELVSSRPEITDKVPVVFLTAMDEVPKSKAIGFIKKTTDISSLLEAINRFIEIGVGESSCRH